jgi:hypothetical protein
VVEPAPEHLILRTVATRLMRIALQCDALAAEMSLIRHLAERPSDEWRARFWSPQFEATPGGVLWPRSLFEEFTKILKTRFWPEVCGGQDGAHIELNGSLAAYVGPLRLTPEWTEVRTSKGVIIIPRDAIIRSTVNWQAEVHLYAIRLPLSPLVEALRRDGGYVEMALAQLVEEKLLTAALVDSLSSPAPIIPSEPKSVVIASEPKGPLKYRVPAALERSVSPLPGETPISPLPGEGYEDWAKRALPSDNPHSVATILTRNKDLWVKAGGTPPKPGRKPPLNHPR